MLKEPQSVDECVYFTNRTLGEGKIKCWVFRENCPKCSQGLMGKPRDPKTGKPKIRSDLYECPSCKYSVPLKEYEDTLTASIKYTCPHCKNEGETQIPFKRKKVKAVSGFYSSDEAGEEKKVTMDALRFQCSKCKKDIDISRKMKGI